MDDQIPLPLKLKRSNAFSLEQTGVAGYAGTNRQIIIISSKSLSNRARDILSTAGYLRIFNYDKFCRWTLAEFIEGSDYTFFNVSDDRTMMYLSSQFKLLKDYSVVLLKHSYESTDEDWIQKMKSEISCTIITHVPDERKKKLLDVLLLNTVALVTPESRVKKLLKYLFRCISSRD